MTDMDLAVIVGTFCSVVFLTLGYGIGLIDGWDDNDRRVT